MSRPKATLKRGKARPLWAGNPWVYSGAIASLDGEAEAGDLVDVIDDRGQLVGAGTWNPTARIAVRLLSVEPSDGWLRRQIDSAKTVRRRFGLPGPDTTAYRLLNGEGDGIPGVICDVLGDLASVQLTTAAAERWQPEIMAALDQPVVRVSVPEDSARMEGIAPGDRLGRGDHEEHIEVKEHGIVWRLMPGKGQKTGFYTDQRDNRAAMAGLAGGASVLDLYCYVGGFALNAARGGAREVVGVDSSGPAVSVAAGTAKANGFEQARFHREDAIRFMRELGDRRFDIVVCDPPKLARRQHNLDDAYKKYLAINAEAIQRVESGGLLISCSCSGLVTEEMFLRMLSDAAIRAGRRLTMHRMAGPGADHPTPLALPEGRYLKVVFARVI